MSEKEVNGLASLGEKLYSEYQELPWYKQLIMDIAPVSGEAISAYETPKFAEKTKEAYEKGDYLEAAGHGTLTGLSALGAIPFVGAGIRGIKAGVKGVSKGLSSLDKSLPKIIDIHDDLSFPELLTGYIVSPDTLERGIKHGVTRPELVNRINKSPELQNLSRSSLEKKGYTDTVPLYRLGHAKEGEFVSEGIVSTSLTPKSHLDTVKYLTEGKTGGLFDEVLDLRMIRYDVPIEKVIGYLPAFKNQIKRGVNKAVKSKNMGQQHIKGFKKIGDPSKHAKKLLGMQEEVIADVTGLVPNYLKIFDTNSKLFNPSKVSSRHWDRIAKIGSGEIKTVKDFRKTMPSHEMILDPFSSKGQKLFKEGGEEAFIKAEDKIIQEMINHYKKHFDKGLASLI